MRFLCSFGTHFVLQANIHFKISLYIVIIKTRVDVSLFFYFKHQKCIFQDGRQEAKFKQYVDILLS